MEIRGSVSGRASSPGHERGSPPHLAGSESSSRARRERERVRRSEGIIAAASKLFAQFGIEKTSMKQIADEADVSVGKLYTYFTGKQEIVRQLLVNAFGELERKGKEARREGDTPLEQLRCSLRAFIVHFRDHMDFLMIYHNENPTSCEGVLEEQIERYAEDAANLLAQAIDEGEIVSEDPRVLASVIIGSAHGLLHMYAESGNKEAFEEVPAIIDRIILKPLETRQTRDTGMEGR
jgi:AcrR family transcriptional regulator